MLKILQNKTKQQNKTTYIGFRDDDSYARRLKTSKRTIEEGGPFKEDFLKKNFEDFLRVPWKIEYLERGLSKKTGNRACKE